MHDGKMDHAHKEVRPSAYIFDTQLTLQYGSSAALFLFTGAGGNIANRAISLLLRAPEVMTDFFMCITWPAAHLCGVRPAAFLYIAGKDAR